MAVAFGIRRQVRVGPALHITPLPVAGLTLSALGHVAFIALLVLAVNTLKEHESKTYIVNLVPAVAALGNPRGTTSIPAPPTPPVARPPQPTPTPPAKTPPPVREVAPAPRELPPRELPPRQSSRSLSLPERSLPTRAPMAVASRAEQKELPTVASSVTPPPPSMPSTPAPRSPAAVTTPTAPPPPPPATAGQLTGSPLGLDPITADVSNFPYAWYVAAVVRKVRERWDTSAIPGQQPTVMFDIGRNGQVNPGSVKVEASSGNIGYDRLAARSIVDAAPFPELPSDFKGPTVTFHMRFNFGRN